jgi:hypothetical protein
MAEYESSYSPRSIPVVRKLCAGLLMAAGALALLAHAASAATITVTTGLASASGLTATT